MKITNIWHLTPILILNALSKWHEPDISEKWWFTYKVSIPTCTKNLERYLMCTFYYHITDHFWVGAEQPAAPHKNWQEKLLNIGFYRYYVRHIFSWVGSQSMRKWFLIWLPPKTANKDWIYFFCIPRQIYFFGIKFFFKFLNIYSLI